MQNIKISVREIVEFCYRKGDIDSSYMGKNRMLEGIYVHQKIQKKNALKYALMDYQYNKEFTLSCEIQYKKTVFLVEGRADAVITGNGDTIIEEIKSTMQDVDRIEYDENHPHLAQAKFYGYILCKNNNIDVVKIDLLYVNANTYSEKSFAASYSFEELESFVNNLLSIYFKFHTLKQKINKKAEKSIEKVSFPYENFRPNQRDLMAYVYKEIINGNTFFVQAPTGTGKTISTLFPALKTMLFNTEKVFYLTSKTITRKVVEESVSDMSLNGLKIKSLTLNAKEKLCFYSDMRCNPKDCIFASGHFTRVNDAILDIVEHEDYIVMDIVLSYAEKHRVCPHEYQLDIANFAHLIICDYNYAYDPNAQLKRFFKVSNKENFVLLHDEAHNLLDRARQMFSISLSVLEMKTAKKLFGDKQIKKYLRSIENIITEGNDEVLTEIPMILIKVCYNLCQSLDEFFTENIVNDKEMLNFYFKILDFLKICELFNDNFRVYYDNTEKRSFHILCVDPSRLLWDVQKNVISSIFFSATLSPIKYFKSTLTKSDKVQAAKISSPFDSKKQKVIIDKSLYITYKNRENAIIKLIEKIYLFTSGKIGNYMIFFSAYSYMDKVYEAFIKTYPSIKTMKQYKDLTEKDKESFLAEFSDAPKETMIAFVVLGGMFSEGIDLTLDRLIGVMVIGVGLPLLSKERQITSDYYDLEGENGFSYAYIYPGVGKVLQAAGRLIRTENDKGIIYLVDGRYCESAYYSLLPDFWENKSFIISNDELIDIIDDFWLS